MIGVFAKFPDFEPVKTRLQARLSRESAEAFHLAALTDVLETAALADPRPVLFLSRGADRVDHVRRVLTAAGLPAGVWTALRVLPQSGAGLGERLEGAFQELSQAGGPALVIGCDSPSLTAAMLHAGCEALAHGADVVLGPVADGGYWAIGVQQPFPGLLDSIPWSTSSTLAATRDRALERGLRVELLESWTDADEPGDLPVLAAQIAALRRGGDARTARRTEAILRTLAAERA